MKMKMLMYILLLSLFTGPTFADAPVVNTDKPLKGDLNFELKREWTVEGAGNVPFAWIQQILVSGEGTLYVFDRKIGVNYIFSSDGSYKGTFGSKGEGPGEAKYQRGLLYGDGKVVIDDRDHLSYFTADGKFLRNAAVKNPYYIPFAFLNRDEIVTAPRTALAASEKDNKGEILRFNLNTQTQSVIDEFPIFTGGTYKDENVQFSVYIPELTPAVIIGTGGQVVYYGMSDCYKINRVTLDGKKQASFVLPDRKKKKVPDRAIVDYFGRKGIKIPEEILKKLLKGLPGETTYFSQIEIHNGLLYVYVSDMERRDTQQIDIFSLDGKYLYRSFIRVPEALLISINPFIIGNYIYLVLEDNDGELMIGRYKTTLPSAGSPKA